jgi:nucleoside-diphosphate-sugar epimerase
MYKKWGIVGCGWLGFPLAKQLAAEGFTVYGTTSTTAKLETLSRAGINSYLLNQDDFDLPHHWLGEVHVLVLNIPPSAFGENYGSAMSNIVKQLNANCNVIFVSSTSVYSDENREVSEHTQANGTSRNAVFVRNAEEGLREILGKRLTVLRMAGLVGERRHPIYYLSGKTVKGANNPVNLIHLEDCIGVIRKVEQENYWGEIINVCASEHPIKKIYYEQMARALDLASPQFIEDEAMNFKIVDNRKSKEHLGYEYRFDDPFNFSLKS